MGFNVVKVIHRRLQRSIQTRLFVMLFLLGVISLFTLVATSIWLGKNEIQAEVSKRNQEIALLVSSQVEANYNNIISNLQLEAHTLNEIERNPRATGMAVRFFQYATSNGFQQITWIDKNGKRRPLPNGEFNPPPPPSLPPDAPQFLPVQASDDFSSHPAYLATKTGKVYFAPMTLAPPGGIAVAAVPIQTDDNNFNGALLVEIDLRRILAIVNTINMGQTSTVMVLDAQGRKLASSDPRAIGQMLNQPDLVQAYNKQAGKTMFTENDQSYLAGYAPVRNQTNWGIVVSESVEEASAGINRLGFVAGGLAIVLIIITVVVGIVVSKGITRPVRELAVAANRITTTGNLDAQIPITTQDEVGELTASFNGMILALRKTRMALEHWNRELEHKVEIRTQEQARVNAQLEQTNLQLERANLHKSQFLANMSHELRTPLNAIIGFSEVMQDQVFGSLNEKQTRYVNNILTSGRHLLALVNDVLDLSKVEAGKMELHWEEFSVPSAVYEVQTQLSTLAEQKNLQVIYEVDENLDRILADRARFRQILFNLLSNAIKFTPQGGRISITGSVQPDEKCENCRAALFRVVDTGIGISAENLTYIFESFRQVDNSYSRQYQGTGLGLALTQKLVEMHGGKIWVESEPGVGSTFSFTIPLITTAAPGGPNPANLLAEVGAADAGL